MAITKIPNSGFETPFNSNKIINDISTLALREATAENRVAYNSNSSFVDVFQDTSSVTNFVNASRNDDEYISAEVVAELDLSSASITQSGSLSSFTPANLIDDNITTEGFHTDSAGVGTLLKFDLGSGVAKKIVRAKIYTDATAYASWQFQGSNNDSSYTNLGSVIHTQDNGNAYADTGIYINTTAYRYYQFNKQNSAQGGQYHREVKLYEGSGINATASFEGNTITAPSSVSSMGGLFTYQDNSGTNALNTDIILQLSADGGSNYTTTTLTALPDFSSGIKMAKANDVSVTAGTSLKYKISFANQSTGSKEARIRGVSLQY